MEITVDKEKMIDAAEIVLSALDVRYDVWRQEALQNKSDFQTFEIMDRMHRSVKRYINDMLGLNDVGSK